MGILLLIRLVTVWLHGLSGGKVASSLWDPANPDLVYCQSEETEAWLESRKDEFGYSQDENHILLGEYSLDDVIIVDTWTRKVTGRTIPAGQWLPAYIETIRSSLGAFPCFIHPDGSFYIFDASLKPREYRLKRLANDWRKELGVDTRRVGRMKQNKVPLYSQSKTSSDFNGYNDENEYVWVPEEKSVSGAGGTPVAWFKIRKMDGREGWIPSATVHFESAD